MRRIVYIVGLLVTAGAAYLGGLTRSERITEGEGGTAEVEGTSEEADLAKVQARLPDAKTLNSAIIGDLMVLRDLEEDGVEKARGALERRVVENSLILLQRAEWEGQTNLAKFSGGLRGAARYFAERELVYPGPPEVEAIAKEKFDQVREEMAARVREEMAARVRER